MITSIEKSCFAHWNAISDKPEIAILSESIAYLCLCVLAVISVAYLKGTVCKTVYSLLSLSIVGIGFLSKMLSLAINQEISKRENHA